MAGAGSAASQRLTRRAASPHGTRHPWKGSRRYRSGSGRHRLEEKGLRERSVAAATYR